MTTIFLYIATFVSLSFWFYFKNEDEKRGLAGKAFLTTGALYIAASLFLPTAGSTAVGIGLHLLCLFVAGFFINTFSNYKLVFFSLLILLSGGYFYSQTGGLPFGNTTPPLSEQSTPMPTNLDGKAELLIEISNGHQVAELQSIVEQYQLELTAAFSPQDGANTDLDDYYTVNIPPSREANYSAIVATLRNSGLIDNVEDNEMLSVDPLETQQASAPPSEGAYTVNDPDLSKVWGFESMQVQALYDYIATNKLKPKKKAKIAIIDTGVDDQHEDLTGNFVSIDTKHNDDPIGHGTHCAGIAAAVTNNSKGIASFSPNGTFVSVTSVKVFGKYGNTSQKRIIDGMIEAVDNGATVLSMSLGGPSTDQNQKAYRAAVKYANQKGAIVVVAAGNENMNAKRRAPASVVGVITVAAIDNQLQKASFSNTVGDLKMGIAAPGVQVYSTIPDNKYDYLNGTSMATPYVAGLVALLQSLKPNITTEQVYEILQRSGSETLNTTQTGKLIQPVAAVKQLLKK